MSIERNAEILRIRILREGWQQGRALKNSPVDCFSEAPDGVLVF